MCGPGSGRVADGGNLARLRTDPIRPLPHGAPAPALDIAKPDRRLPTEAGRCFPSVRLLSNVTGTPRSTVAYHLAQLAQLGIVARQRRPGGVYAYTIAARFLPGPCPTGPKTYPTGPHRRKVQLRKQDRTRFGFTQRSTTACRALSEWEPRLRAGASPASGCRSGVPSPARRAAGRRWEVRHEPVVRKEAARGRSRARRTRRTLAAPVADRAGQSPTSRNWAQVLRTTNMATLAQWQTAAGFAEGARLTAIERILAHAQGREIDPKRPLLGQLDITLPGGAA